MPRWSLGSFLALNRCCFGFENFSCILGAYFSYLRGIRRKSAGALFSPGLAPAFPSLTASRWFTASACSLMMPAGRPVTL